MQNTHTHKAQSYDLGRPAYPAAFYDWLYGAFGLSREAVIADIGAGTGTVTKGFLEHGNRVVAVESDNDMRAILAKKLSGFEGCTILGNSAEDTGIAAASVNLIFCGNAYHWFDRARAVLEFKRILKDGSGANVVIAMLNGIASSPFREGTYAKQKFPFVLNQSWDTFLHGNLSASSNPSPGDDHYKEFVNERRRYFDKHSRDGLLATEFRLSCAAGNVNDLI